MSLLSFLLETMLISLSGVLAPGPVTAAIVGKGTKSPHAGAWVAIGHGIVEFPLMISILYGFGRLLNVSHVGAIIGLVGGLLLVYMGVGMFRGIRWVEVDSRENIHSPVVAGLLLSLSNPYFLIWWVTVGATLIVRSISFGLVGFLLFALVHWSCDFLWGYFLSALSFKGGRFFGRRFQKTVFAVCGVFLLFFGGKFLLDAVRGLFAPWESLTGTIDPL